MKKAIWTLVGLGLTALLAACGGAGGGGNSIAGTVSGPGGYTVSGTVVVACPGSVDVNNCDETTGKYTTLSGSGRSSAYRIEGIGAGDWYVLAVSPQKFLGGYVDGSGNLLPVKAGATGINISMFALP